MGKNPLPRSWSGFGHFTRARSLAQMLGIWGLLVLVGVIVGALGIAWAWYERLSFLVRVSVGLGFALIVLILWALVSYLFGSYPSTTEKRHSVLTDERGSPLELPRANGRRTIARAVFMLSLVGIIGIAYFVGWIDALVLRLKPEISIFMKGEMVGMPLTLGDGKRSRLFHSLKDAPRTRYFSFTR